MREEWEKEFDEKFGKTGDFPVKPVTREELKEFIRIRICEHWLEKIYSQARGGSFYICLKCDQEIDMSDFQKRHPEINLGLFNEKPPKPTTQ